MRHRPEIDGLRAVAVLPVLLFHAGLPGFSGGFVGVDVFFVISGYLITILLTEDLARRRLSLRQFYLRRARRILPALLAMMIVTLPLAWGWMTPAQLRAFGAEVLAVLFFSANILHIFRDTGYFAPDTDLQPLLHTWSLAVEEQFYLLYPIAIALIWRHLRRRIVPILCLIAVASFALADWAAVAHPQAAFYLLPTRIWELLAGAIAALLPPPRRALLPGLIGLAMIAGAVALFDAATPFPGRYALLPVIGAVLVLRHAGPGTPAARLLSLPPFTAIGLVSYSAYLWHQPILAFTRLRQLADPSPGTMLAAVLLSLLFGAISWRLIERPFRHPATLSLPWLAPFAALLVGFSTLGLVSQGAGFRFPSQVQAQLQGAEWSSECLFQKADGPVAFPIDRCTFGSGPRRVALVGDSVAASFAPALIAHFADRGTTLSQMTHGLCYPALRSRWIGPLADPCPGFIARAIAEIDATGYDLVIVMASWPSFDGDVRYDGAPLPPLDDMQAAILAADISDTLARIDAPVLLLMPQPQAPVPVSDYAAKYFIAQGRPLVTFSQSVGDFLTQQGSKFAVLERVTAPNLIRLYPHEALCDRTRCPFVEDKALILSDTMHLTRFGGAKLMGWPPLRQALQ